MPRFIPEHTPRDLNDLERGYLEAAEWLLDEEVDRAKVRGFSKAAIKEAKRVCATFMAMADQTLGLAMGALDLPLSQAGHDLWLTSNRHGAGFWDGDWGEWGDTLTTLAHACPERSPYVEHGWIYLE